MEEWHRMWSHRTFLRSDSEPGVLWSAMDDLLCSEWACHRGVQTETIFESEVAPQDIQGGRWDDAAESIKLCARRVGVVLWR